jgi:PqqD family protein of HPr-rel-A system
MFDDESVVFNPFSWETHVLNPAATLVLEALRRGPCRAADVSALLAEALDEAERAQAQEHAERLLREFGTLRLIAPAHDAGRRAD